MQDFLRLPDGSTIQYTPAFPSAPGPSSSFIREVGKRTGAIPKRGSQAAKDLTNNYAKAKRTRAYTHPRTGQRPQRGIQYNNNINNNVREYTLTVSPATIARGTGQTGTLSIQAGSTAAFNAPVLRLSRSGTSISSYTGSVARVGSIRSSVSSVAPASSVKLSFFNRVRQGTQALKAYVIKNKIATSLAAISVVSLSGFTYALLQNNNNNCNMTINFPVIDGKTNSFVYGLDGKVKTWSTKVCDMMEDFDLTSEDLKRYQKIVYVAIKQLNEDRRNILHVLSEEDMLSTNPMESTDYSTDDNPVSFGPWVDVN